jgi:hypothetical protein
MLRDSFGNPSHSTGGLRDRRCQVKSAERYLLLVKQSIRRFPSSTKVGQAHTETMVVSRFETGPGHLIVPGEKAHLSQGGWDKSREQITGFPVLAP